MSRQRYEKEIEEILERAGDEPHDEPRQSGGRPPQRQRSSPPPRRGPAVRQFGLKYQYALIAGIALIVIGGILHWLYFFLAGLVLLVAGYVIYYRAPRRGGGGGDSTNGTRQMWRGRPIDPDDPPGRSQGK